MSFILLILYLFCTFIRPQDWIPELERLRLVNFISLATIFSLYIERIGSKKGGFVNAPQSRLMIGLFISILLSQLAHTYIEGAKEAFSSFLIIFILYFIILNAINTETKFKIAIGFMVFFIFLLVFQGMYQLEYGYGWAGQRPIFQNNSMRITWVGIFNDPNDLALIFVMAVSISIALFFGRSNYFMRLLAIPVIGFFCYGIFLTNSRGGMLALMASILYYFVKKTRKFMIGGIIGGLFIALIIVLGPSRLGLISIEEDSAYGRVNLWYEGILLLKSNPVFGVGYNMFMEDLPQTAHNSYLLAAAELGMLGLFFWMSLIYISMKGLTLVQETDAKLKDYALGLQSALIGFCVAAFFLSRTYVIIPYMLFALSGSLIYIVRNKNPGLEFKFTLQDAKRSLGLGILSLVLVYAIIKLGL